MKEKLTTIEQIEAELMLALKPVWRLPKAEQAPLIERFINRTMQKAQSIHEPVAYAERILEEPIEIGVEV